jgi:hypothetical protein
MDAPATPGHPVPVASGTLGRHGDPPVRLRIGTLAKALGGLLGLFVGIPVAVMLVPEGQMDAMLFGASVACAVIAWLKPGWGRSFWGAPPAASLLVVVLGCNWARSLAGVPDAVRSALGILMFAALLAYAAAAKLHQTRAQTQP